MGRHLMHLYEVGASKVFFWADFPYEVNGFVRYLPESSDNRPLVNHSVDGLPDCIKVGGVDVAIGVVVFQAFVSYFQHLRGVGTFPCV